MDIITLFNDPLYGPLIMLGIILWVLPWKGVALWKAARRNQWMWFVALLVFNTLAILPIIYIFLIAPRYAEIGEDEKGISSSDKK
jgi:hypothetical protein